MTPPTATALAVVPHVRQISSLTSDDITDNALAKMVIYAWQDLMGRVQKEERFEPVQYIDQYRQNVVDGTNKTFFTKNSFTRYMGDLDLDMNLTATDMQVWEMKNDQSYDKLDVDTIDEDGFVVLDDAPGAGSKLFINYSHLPVKFFTNLDPRLRNALAYLTTSLAYGKLDPGDYERVGFRGIVMQKARRGGPNLHLGQAFDSWMGRYTNAIEELNSIQSIVRKDDLERAYALQVRATYLTPPQ